MKTIVAIVIALAFLAHNAFGQVIGQPAPVIESVKIGKPDRSKVIVRGCHGEDTCTANFRKNSHWVIKRVVDQ